MLQITCSAEHSPYFDEKMPHCIRARVRVPNIPGFGMLVLNRRQRLGLHVQIKGLKITQGCGILPFKIQKQPLIVVEELQAASVEVEIL
jgi:hypothetical protein